jgi:hypothetical protein
MTRKIPAVAVCWSSAFAELMVALFKLREQPHVLDRDNGLVGEGLDQFDLRGGEDRIRSSALGD